MEKLSSLITLFSVDLVIGILVVLGLLLLAKTRRAAAAVLRRNFLAYFTNPTGYVFLCLFVLLTSFAAFWPDAFFNSNLANLDQLNVYIPVIMLIFIPAITMSIWAEERRQGTDELLLTMPAGDFDIVLGKYLAAVSIFTVSLLFSQCCNYLVLQQLGDPDAGLFLGNYFGYWLVGVAMLAVGMVASFLTSNLTVGFVLGIVFNTPLVAANWSQVFLGDSVAKMILPWSIAEQLQDFESGVISLASVVYFLLVVAVMIYLSMVLIGRRHWRGGPDGNAMGSHFLVRTISLIVLAGSLSALFASSESFRTDVTSEKINSLSPDTVKLLEDLEPEFPVKIDVYMSKDLPQDFAQRRRDMRSRLREMDHSGGSDVTTEVHETELLSEEALRVQKRYGIHAVPVSSQDQGTTVQRDVILGMVCKSGSEKVVVPFLGKGTPIEYELIRSIVTVTQKKKKKIGVLVTDANLIAGGSFMNSHGDQPFVSELRKQYEVVPVDASKPISDDLAMLIAAQPSSLLANQKQNFLNAVRRGLPTAIFEDPYPQTLGQSVTGTSQPRRPMNGGLIPRDPPPKINLKELWRLLEVQLESGTKEINAAGPGRKRNRLKVDDPLLIWQQYNPHPSETWIRKQMVFITPTANEKAFSDKSSITSGLQEVLFPFPGGIKPTKKIVKNRKNTITELIRTSADKTSGYVKYNDLFRRVIGQMGRSWHDRLLPERAVESLDVLESTSGDHVLAVHIQGPEPTKELSEKEESAEKKVAKRPLNVVLVADLDVLSSDFFYIRVLGETANNPVSKWQLDNVAFVLNIVDVLAGQTDFVEIRKRRPKHRELTTVKMAKDRANDARAKERKETEDKMNKVLDEAEKQMMNTMKALAARRSQGNTDIKAAMELVAINQKNAQEDFTREKARLERQQEEKRREIDRKSATEIRHVQDNYKFWAVVLPPIPPLLIAICVFFVRRGREREGVSSLRRR